LIDRDFSAFGKKKFRWTSEI